MIEEIKPTTTPDKAVDQQQACSATFDDDHHAMMNGPRIAQSLPKEYLEALLKAASSQNASDQ
jgi:hypothetical protein